MAQHYIVPQQPLLVSKVPSSSDYIHEVKFDGYRMLAYVERHDVRLISRNGVDFSNKFPTIVEALAELKGPLILDGEIVFINDEGRSDFEALRRAIGKKHLQNRIQYFVFDLLKDGPKDLRELPLIKRRDRLVKLSHKFPNEIHLSEVLNAKSEAIFKMACEYRLEGIVSKRKNSTYVSGKNSSRDWVKTKCVHRQEFVAIGFAAPEGRSSGIGPLLLGEYVGETLVYAGRVKQVPYLAVKDILKAGISKKAVAENVPEEFIVTWLKPKIVVEVEFLERTSGGSLRHASFVGIRIDKSALQVTRELSL